MLSVLQKRLAVFLLAVILSPAAVTTCVASPRCEGPGDAAHACCNTPMLGACDCADAPHLETDQAEPARRHAGVAPELSVSTLGDVLIAPPAAIVRDTSDPRPPKHSRDRLSLLAILVV